MDEEQQTIPPQTEEEAEVYEGTPEELTSFKKEAGPAWFDRKKVMTVLCAVFAAVVMMGVVFGSMKSKKKTEAAAVSGQAARAPNDFLQRELARSREAKPREAEPGSPEPLSEPETEPGPDGLPAVTAVSLAETAREQPARTARQIAEPPEYEGSGGGMPPPTTYPFSPLVPVMEGSLFPSSSSQNQQQAGYPPSAAQYDPSRALEAYLQNTAPARGNQTQDSYALQNNQGGKQAFYDTTSKGTSLAGVFLEDNLLWVGTIIPAVLETAVNTDLPGNILARVSENIYDSRTGKKLLVPQGTVLVAQYNSSVSYAQRRVQIVWDLLIRPDGYQLELEGMNGVDPKGMAGLKAQYKEHWFEYIKAAGIISMFSTANAKMAEQVAKYGSNEMAAGVISSNAEFIKDIGGNIVSRAVDIQPTLTVPSGEKISVMLNKNVYFPPVDDNPVTQRYTLR